MGSAYPTTDIYIQNSPVDRGCHWSLALHHSQWVKRSSLPCTQPDIWCRNIPICSSIKRKVLQVDDQSKRILISRSLPSWPHVINYNWNISWFQVGEVVRRFVVMLLGVWLPLVFLTGGWVAHYCITHAKLTWTHLAGHALGTLHGMMLPHSNDTTVFTADPKVKSACARSCGGFIPDGLNHSTTA